VFAVRILRGVKRTTAPKKSPAKIDELALTSDQWHQLRDDLEPLEIVRFHQPHPAFLIA
jgi:hypothetical protein